MKHLIITAIAALGFAAPAVAQSVDGAAQVMTRNVPAETVFGPADDGRHFDNAAVVSFGERIVVELDQYANDTPARGDLVTAYVFEGVGDQGFNDFNLR